MKKINYLLRYSLMLGILTGFLSSCDNRITESVTSIEEPSPNLEKISVLAFKPTAKNDNDMIQNAINYAATNNIPVVTIPDGAYHIDVIKSVFLKSNIHLQLSPNAVVKAIPTSLSGVYAIFKIHNVTNTKISGGKLVGERYSHLGNSGEWGMGIDIRGATKFEINNITITDCWGDAIYIAGKSKNGSILNVICDNNRRQGVSVVSVDGLAIKNSLFKNTKGAAPQAGVDIEPNKNDVVKNVSIENCTFLNNAGYGLNIYGGTGLCTDITAKNCIIDKSNIGLSIGGGEGVLRIAISDFKISNCPSQSIAINKGSDVVNISKVDILNSAKNAVTVNRGLNVKLSGLNVKGYTTTGLDVQLSNFITVESSTFSTTNVNATGANVGWSTDINLTSTNFDGGIMGVKGTDTERFSISNNKIMNMNRGISLNYVRGSTISTNTLQNIKEIPLEINMSSTNKILNNTFINNCIGASNTYSQILFTGTAAVPSSANECKGNKIQNGTAANKAKYGIFLTADSKTNTVSNNTIQAGSYITAAIKNDNPSNIVTP